MPAAAGSLVARIYAGILGPLALLVCLARGVVHAWDAQTTLLWAWISLWVFAAVGAVLGWIAGRIVDDEIRSRISAEQSSKEESAPKGA